MEFQTKCDKPMPNLFFRGMTVFITLRNKFSPPKSKLKEAGIEVGFHVLDYGCGPGNFSFAAAKLVGSPGKVYAVDIHPLAIQHIQNIAAKKGIYNIEAIETNCATGLDSNSIDVIFCYDVLHMLCNYNNNIEEFHRILKPSGILSLDDHHMKEAEIIIKVEKQGYFKLEEKMERTYRFRKVEC